LLGPFQKEEEETGVTSVLVKLKVEEPAPLVPLKRNDTGTVTIPK